MNVIEREFEAKRQPRPTPALRDFAVFLACVLGGFVLWIFKL